MILTDHAILHYLELPKLSGYQQKTKLSRWLKFLSNEGKAKGFTRGEVKGKADDILKILEMKFGTVSNPLAEKIKSLNNIEILDELIELAVTIDNIEKLSSYLK